LSLLFDSFVAVLTAGICSVTFFGQRLLAQFERAAAQFSRRKTATILCLGLVTIVSRLALLPVLPVPLPAIHDEFSYLLAADTFAHGRLANPPHPMWIFFDTFHVLQHPTYASKYPPAPGLLMALGQLLGHPWIGVLITTALMVMAVTWMLQGWLPPPWALLGGSLVFLRFGLFNFWVDSYYNGSIATVGAALVLGALPRIQKRPRSRYAALMGLGATILACSRPVEGFIFCVPVAVALVLQLVAKIRSDAARTFRRILFPLGATLLAGVAAMAYYNLKVAHDPLKLPYLVYHHQYFAYPAFIWQTPRPALHYDNPQFEAFFNVWQRDRYPKTWRVWLKNVPDAFGEWWAVYLGPLLTVPFLMLPWLLRNRKMLVPLVQFALCLSGLLLVVWHQPHYGAPLAAAVFVLLVQGMRHLRRVKWKDWAFGVLLTRILVLFTISWICVGTVHFARHPLVYWYARKAQVNNTLASLPGNHLVLVRYLPSHNVLQEWVYNEAEIDRAKVVWARDIPYADLNPLLAYFKDRNVWVVDADLSPPHLEPYRKPTAP
jgi:hypothetical protein